MSKVDDQARFAEMVALLILWAHGQRDDKGHPRYRITFGAAYDPPGSGSGRSERSFHRQRLAIDLNLFVWTGAQWIYQTSTGAHRPLGEFWESLGGSWGGRFKNADGNHYSLGELPARGVQSA